MKRSSLQKLLLQKKTLTFPETCLATAPGSPLSFHQIEEGKREGGSGGTETWLSLLGSPDSAPY